MDTFQITIVMIGNLSEPWGDSRNLREPWGALGSFVDSQKALREL